MSTPELDAFADRLRTLPGVRGLWVGGSLATGDFRPGVSDLDLVALVDGPPPAGVREVHDGIPAGARLGCVYVDAQAIADVTRHHPTFTHGVWIERPLSGVARAELLRSGYAVFGRPPGEMLTPLGPEEIRAAVRAELDGYWHGALRRPWEWLDLDLQDLALTTAARAGHGVRTGELITKASAIEQLPDLGVPAWLVERTRRRRSGERLTRGRFRGALVAWRVIAAVRAADSTGTKSPLDGD